MDFFRKELNKFLYDANIISIDTIGCVDIDDAISLIQKEYIELGIHIADPTSFIELNSDLGKELIKTDQHFLKVEAGPGVRHSERRNSPPNDDAIALLSIDYEWKINQNTKFIHVRTLNPKHKPRN